MAIDSSEPTLCTKKVGGGSMCNHVSFHIDFDCRWNYAAALVQSGSDPPRCSGEPITEMQ